MSKERDGSGVITLEVGRSAHRLSRDSRVHDVGWSGFPFDEGAQSVTHCDGVRQQARNSPIAVGERVDANPFAMSNGARGDNSLELLTRQRNAKTGNPRVERRQGRRQVAQEVVDCRSDVTGPHTDPVGWLTRGSDKSNFVVDQFSVAGVTTIVAHVLCGRHRAALVELAVPFAQASRREWLSKLGVGLR